MEHVEMLVGYDINNFEKKFEENYERLSVYMYKFFKNSIGERVAAIHVEQNLLLAWSYYFVTIADEKPENGDSLMYGMLAHFEQIMSGDENIEIHGDKESHSLVLDYTLTKIWFGTSVFAMLNFIYGEGKGEDAMKYLEKEYLVKNKEYRSMILQEQEEITK